MRKRNQMNVNKPKITGSRGLVRVDFPRDARGKTVWAMRPAMAAHLGTILGSGRTGDYKLDVDNNLKVKINDGNIVATVTKWKGELSGTISEMVQFGERLRKASEVG
jgi:hypothetical protein